MNAENMTYSELGDLLDHLENRGASHDELEALAADYFEHRPGGKSPGHLRRARAGSRSWPSWPAKNANGSKVARLPFSSRLT